MIITLVSIDFPDYNNTTVSLEKSYKNYFKNNPYNKWFGQDNAGF